MTPEEKAKLQEHLKQAAEILYKDTPESELLKFGTIELVIREHLQDTVAPEISNFFITQQGESQQEEKEKCKPAQEK